MNEVTLSVDGMEMTIKSTRGHVATLRSTRPGGFTESDIEGARNFKFNTRMIDGQVNRARLYRLGGRDVLVQVNTGPPTWWIPRVKIRCNKVVIGWLRILVAVSWERRKG